MLKSKERCRQLKVRLLAFGVESRALFYMPRLPTQCLGRAKCSRMIGHSS